MIGQFTVEEINLICFFDTSARDALIQDLIAAIDGFEDDEVFETAQSALNKVTKMSGEDFAALDFYPIYDDDEETEVYA
jgi:hypothetical protein